MADGRQHYKACGRRHKGQAILPRGLKSLHAAYTNDLDGLEQAEVTDEITNPSPSSFWTRSRRCCRTVRRVVDFPEPAEPPR